MDCNNREGGPILEYHSSPESELGGGERRVQRGESGGQGAGKINNELAASARS